MTLLQVTALISTLATALALVPTGAHALELRNKMNLSQAEYFTVQQIYQGWNRTGIFEGVALISSIVVLLLIPNQPIITLLSLIATISLIGMALTFWLITLPTNKDTANWTEVPAEWKSLRNRWEYSHVVRAGCALTALSALVGVSIQL